MVRTKKERLEALMEEEDMSGPKMSDDAKDGAAEIVLDAEDVDDAEGLRVYLSSLKLAFKQPIAN